FRKTEEIFFSLFGSTNVAHFLVRSYALNVVVIG
ncbi:MAG: hypothetical protein ACI9XB_002309, partial [Gammaproteobacteria bacterium]